MHSRTAPMAHRIRQFPLRGFIRQGLQPHITRTSGKTSAVTSGSRRSNMFSETSASQREAGSESRQNSTVCGSVARGSMWSSMHCQTSASSQFSSSRRAQSRGIETSEGPCSPGNTACVPGTWKGGACTCISVAGSSESGEKAPHPHHITLHYITLHYVTFDFTLHYIALGYMTPHTYIHTYIHTYLHTYILTYLHTYILTYVHTYLHTYIHTCMHTYIHTYEHTHTHT